MPDRNDDATRLQRLVSDFADDRVSCADARSAVAQLVLERLDADRVSFWRFELPRERSDQSLELECFAARRRGASLEGCDDRLELAEYRDYFNALVARGTFASEDAMGDPALEPMRASYLQRHDIRSLLDAAFSLNGRAYGMICGEAIGRRVAWRATDVRALHAIATRLAVLLAGVDAPTLWNGPSLPVTGIAPAR